MKNWIDTLKSKFFSIEIYKLKNNMTGEDVIKLFNKYNVLDFIEECYDVLHTLNDSIIIEDIERYINNR